MPQLLDAFSRPTSAAPVVPTGALLERRVLRGASVRRVPRVVAAAVAATQVQAQVLAAVPAATRAQARDPELVPGATLEPKAAVLVWLCPRLS